MSEPMAYFCKVCGYHPDNKGWYCALGCGRDYNTMVAVPQRHVDKLLAGAAAAPARHVTVTHGRHCKCTACARQDWGEPGLACCGMHGPGCPPRYEPLGYAGQVVPA